MDLRGYVKKANAKYEKMKLDDEELRDDIIRENLEIVEWVECNPFPEEGNLIEWLEPEIAQNPTFFDPRGNFSNVKYQLDTLFDYRLIRAIYEGFVNIYEDDYIVHYGRVRQAGWLIWDRFGFEGMQFYYYLMIQLANCEKLFTMPDANRFGTRIMPNCNMSRHVEYEWEKVGSWRM